MMNLRRGKNKRMFDGSFGKRDYQSNCITEPAAHLNFLSHSIFQSDS